jgi:hypothetical protein
MAWPRQSELYARRIIKSVAVYCVLISLKIVCGVIGGANNQWLMA